MSPDGVELSWFTLRSLLGGLVVILGPDGAEFGWFSLCRNSPLGGYFES